jgi:putative transposase
MPTNDSQAGLPTAWAHLRFSIVGPLLSAPPAVGELKTAINELAGKVWQHPLTGEPIRFSAKTIERWYYRARGARRDPVRALHKAVRKDRGRQVLNPAFVQRLLEQYQQHPNWSVKLHVDNLRVLARHNPGLGRMPAYSTVLRFMRRRGLYKKPRRSPEGRPGLVHAEARLRHLEVRSYEAEYVNGLWHLDFHVGSRAVLTPRGRWIKPVLLGVLDDRSRLCCHAQWYWTETAEDLVHGLCQAFCKWALPRSLMTDNGAAMQAGEFTEGLTRLGVVHAPTLAYSPYQNGTQEALWGPVEGRLLAMLEAMEELTIELLNQATCAWFEMEYNRTVHSETGQTPLERYLQGPDVGRPSGSSEELRWAFRRDVQRTQRRSDGTIPLEGVRFEIPARFRNLRRVTVRYARWNLRDVHLIDPRSDMLLSRNADGRRRVLEPDVPAAIPSAPPDGPMAPLLRELMTEYAATGIPPAYLPHNPQNKESS